MNAHPHKPPAAVTRRRLLQTLASIGITGPLALELVAQSRSDISSEVLRRASQILGEPFTDARLAVVERALQRNLDQFQMVRDLPIDDTVEPAPIFTPKSPYGARATPASGRR
ncbi:MAG: hypothetical protein ABI024_06660 [Vicinamibacterales bacterium]